MKLKIISLALATFFLVGCGAGKTEPISLEEYRIALGAAVCTAVQNLNERGILADEENFGPEFEDAVHTAVNEMGYRDDEWLAAKSEYFTPEEHEKLIRFHFTACLVMPSLAEVEIENAEE